eukprot:CAMPEP_0168747238 /NCGR_PEP_ID=MMETSP0724-20121128/15558_1 /TAXON_ID=265536 /ORGANISM="Amphiprora sp., Strain CCMP467" /LENGTH=1095 /DNA_ID=CAMNT_0008795031 /DNA_START=259 /DNA_END=3546 /DNA_ORIENTATION=-
MIRAPPFINSRAGAARFGRRIFNSKSRPSVILGSSSSDDGKASSFSRHGSLDHFAQRRSKLRASSHRQYRAHFCQKHRLFVSLSTAPVSPALEDEHRPPYGLAYGTENKIKARDNANITDDVEDETIEEYLESKGITSRPKVGGNWNVRDPLGWARDFGGRSKTDEERLARLAHLKPGDEGYFDVNNVKVEGVVIVRTKEQARIVLEKLYAAPLDTLHAADTEVMDIDVRNVGPVGNGYVSCLSLNSGENFDYGLGKPGDTLWIDNLDDAYGILQEFKAWFEDARYLKVWHNYGFDRHVMWNEGIDVKGFGGDTMHMARLHDTNRKFKGGYSLESLTQTMLAKKKTVMKDIFGVAKKLKDGSDGSIKIVPPVEVLQRDPAYREKWILYSAYDAHATFKLREELQNRLEGMKWIRGKNMWDYYSMHMRPFGEVLTDMERRGIRVDARNYLAGVEKQARIDREQHSKAFTDWVVRQYGEDKRAHALALNPASSTQLQTLLFGGAVNKKTGEPTPTVREFKLKREEVSDEAWEAFQEQARREKEAAQAEKGETDKLKDELEGMKATELKALCKEEGLKQGGKKDELKDRLMEHYKSRARTTNTSDKEVQDLAKLGKSLEELSDQELRDILATRTIRVRKNSSRKTLLDKCRKDIETTLALMGTASEEDAGDGYPALCAVLDEAARKGGDTVLAQYLKSKSEKKEPKHVTLRVSSIGDLKPTTFTTISGAPSVTAAVLSELAGDPFADPPKYGSAFETFGKEGCEALFSLCSIGSIDTMIANFLTTLQEFADDDSRVHGQLNINTETGRLSSRKPNLQNQPALEKDKYKIRKAFQSSPGNNLIVADYGQLELRILASLTSCKSMVDAFESGGDFHSRTALDMFDYIQEKVDAGEVLLEWDYSKGDPPKPLIKDEFASERRKAKTLNFSIAYGKTAHGLSKDWGVSKQEAEDMLQKWYNARPEVRNWQQQTKTTAGNHGITRTLMGRYRHIPEAMHSNIGTRSAGERASINTPIQGGAADIAMMAMNKINSSEKLKALGWIMLLQIHDEVILEGPEETAQEAFGIVLECMQEPWVFGLKKMEVPLLVDGSYTHKTWYEAK